MKKYTLFLFVLAFVLLGFDANSVGATGPYNEAGYVSGCIVGDMFSRTTGQPCSTATTAVGCLAGYSFSPVTGQRCTVTTTPTTTSSRLLTIGSRGDDVRAVQQILKDEGYYFGKIDGIYGNRTGRAVGDLQDDYNLPITRNVDSATLAILRTLGIIVTPPIQPPYVSGSPVISGVSGPQSLNVNQTGTWSVTASSSSTGGDLSYSVFWGDEVYSNATPMRNLTSSRPQQSATFTHTYSQAGVYTPRFTVQNEKGQTAQTSLSVNVGGVTTVNFVDLLTTVNYSNSNQDAFIGVDIKGVPENKNVSYWVLDISCSGIANFTDSSPKERCGTRQTYYAYNYFDVTSNISLVTANAQSIPNSYDKSIGFVLTAYGVNRNVLGSDKEVVKLGFTDSLPSITVLSPNGGETYKNDGSPITVNWWTSNVPASKKFDVIRLRVYPNGQEYNLATNVLNDGQEVIAIPSDVPVGSYTLEMKTYVNDTLVMDSSDSYFKIVDVTPPSSGDTVAFAKEFYVNSTATPITLSLAADNQYKIYINGNLIASSEGDWNFNSVHTFNLTNLTPFRNGRNKLNIEVFNNYDTGASQTGLGNPAGLLYKITQNSCVTDMCTSSILATSDGSETVSTNGGRAVVLSRQDPLWTSISGANWIWSYDYYSNAHNQPSVTVSSAGTDVIIDPSLTSTSNAIFTARATGGSGQYKYHWNFGDGMGSDGTVFQGSSDTMGHRYTNPGTYNANVYVVDSTGQRSELVTTTITARLISSAQPSITSITPSSGPIGTSVTIRGNNLANTSSNGSSNYIWFNSYSFGSTIASADGTSVTFVVPNTLTPGAYQVSVKTSLSLPSSDSFPFTITN